MQFKYAIVQLCYLVHFGSHGCPISLTELKQKGGPDFYFLNLFTLGERPKFIGTGVTLTIRGLRLFQKRKRWATSWIPGAQSKPQNGWLYPWTSLREPNNRGGHVIALIVRWVITLFIGVSSFPKWYITCWWHFNVLAVFHPSFVGGNCVSESKSKIAVVRSILSTRNQLDNWFLTLNAFWMHLDTLGAPKNLLSTTCSCRYTKYHRITARNDSVYPESVS